MRRRLSLPLVALTLIFAGALAQLYVSRILLADAQRAGCQRTKTVWRINADGWRQAADLTTGPARARYEQIAHDLLERSRTDCTAAYPGPPTFR